MDIVDAANKAATGFDAFLQHVSAVSFLLSVVGSIAATQLLKYPLHYIGTSPPFHAFLTRLMCATIAFVLAVTTWPNDFRWQWAFTLAVSAPALYWIALQVLYWKWPALAQKFSAQKNDPKC